MVNKTRYYNCPNTNKTTTDIDVYLQSWRNIAAPIEKALGVTLIGFDPGMQFRHGNAQGQNSVVNLPLWFATILSDVLSKTKSSNRDLKDVMMMVQEQFRICSEEMLPDFDDRVFGWVDATVAGTPPNLRG